MTKIISKEEVDHVAKLARINISKEEQDKFSNDLSGILDHFKDLNQLNIDDVKKVDFQKIPENQTRKDQAIENKEDEKERIRGQFPDREDGYLKVKAVL